MPERRRDLLGRPLSADADPSLAAPDVPDVSELTDAEVWRVGIAYLEGGMPFHAHEVFEARWRTAPQADRAAWRALAQWGAALTHQARGNVLGARRLADRAVQTLDGADRIPSCVDTVLVRASCARIDTGDQAAPTE